MNTQEFLNSIDRSLGENGCWLWRKGKTSKGYGSVAVKGYRSNLAHRIAWAIAFGEIPPSSICICHHCDDPACCNPEHLFPGDRSLNNKDKTAKGRNVSPGIFGSKNPMAKLTEEKVIQIKAKYRTGRFTYQSLADRFRVSPALVGLVITGKIWKEVQSGRS